MFYKFSQRYIAFVLFEMVKKSAFEAGFVKNIFEIKCGGK